MRGSLAASFFLLFFLLASRECRSYENHGHRRNLGSRVAGEDGAELFCVADDGSRISTDIEISTTAEATQFTEDVLRCPGADFRVKWEGTVVLNQPLRLNNGTSVTITGSSATSTDDTGEISQVNGGGLTQLFALNGSALHLKRLALTGGKASEGGVVAAHNQASVTIDDCEVYYNTATNMGGESSKGGKLQIWHWQHFSDPPPICWKILIPTNRAQSTSSLLDVSNRKSCGDRTRIIHWGC